MSNDKTISNLWTVLSLQLKGIGKKLDTSRIQDQACVMGPLFSRRRAALQKEEGSEQLLTGVLRNPNLMFGDR